MSSGTVTVRLAEAWEGPMIAELSRRTFYDSFAEYNTPENMDKFMKEQFSLDRLAAEIHDLRNIFALAYISDKLAGYVKLRSSEDSKEMPGPGSIEIARIYAVQESIGKGVGRSLMETSIRIARERKNKWIWLGVWEHNPRAIEFYTRWGFEKFGEHIFWLGDEAQTDWLMKKNLQDEPAA